MRLLFQLILFLHASVALQADGHEERNQHAIPLSLVVAPDVLTNYHRFLDGRHPWEVTDIEGKVERDTLEVFITLYALRKGGLNFFPEFVTTPSLERHIALLKSGSVVISAALIDSVDIENTDTILAAPFLIEDQTQIAGLYTASSNAQALAAKSLDDVKQLTAISNKSWRADWSALSGVGLRELVSVADWVAMCRMVSVGRSDFLLAPLSDSDELVTPVGPLVKMEPFAIKIHAIRKYAISRVHPDSDKVREALEAGLKHIGQDHFIHRAVTRLTDNGDNTGHLIFLND